VNAEKSRSIHLEELVVLVNNRILDISEAPLRLSVSDGCLLLEPEDAKPVRVAFSDIAVVLASHPHGRFSQAALAGLSESGAVFVICDGKHLPIGMMLPMQGNFVQCERFIRQAESPLPIRKRAWSKIVQAKIRAQSRLLSQLGRPDPGLSQLWTKVRSGDPKNIEAQAARRYWGALLPGSSFRRNPEIDDLNRHFNYGYAVLRAIVARAVCAAGLHPGLGLHHHNRYDAFPLADDLMEPYRPIVDAIVIEIAERWAPDAPLDRERKAFLLSRLSSGFEANNEMRSLFDWSFRMASSLVKVHAEEEKEIEIPEIVGRR